MPELITNTATSEVLNFILKGAVLLILIFYAIFALLIIRQVELMTKTLITPVSSFVKTLALVHAVLALGLIVLAFFLL